MPFSRSPLSVIKSEVAADISSAVKGADPLLRFSNLGILGVALANLANLMNGYIDWISLQAVPFTATDEFLEGWAALKRIIRKPAVAATALVTFPGSGATVPLGTSVTRGDGTLYTTNADATASGGVVVVTVIAAVPSAAGTLSVGTVMTLGSAIVGIQASGSVTGAAMAGADVETDDSLRSRMLAEYAAPPQGGDYADYVEWATQVPGVTRAWVNPNGQGAGTVVVYTMFDLSEAAHGGFPQGGNGVASAETRAAAAIGDQLTVANYIFPLQPVTALVFSTAPLPNTVNFTISGLSGSSAATQAAIATAIDTVFLTAGPGGALDASGNVQGTTDLSLIESAIAAISGTAGFVITAPAGNIVSGAGQIPVRGTVTYT